MTNVEYRVSAPRAAAHVYSVRLHIQKPHAAGQRLCMPVWIPGSYMVRDYARHIIALQAESESGVAIEASKLDKTTWQLAPCDESVVVTYEVYGWDLSVRGAHLDLSHAYFNGACLLLEVVGDQSKVSLTIEPMPMLPEQAWVATSLTPESVDERGFGTYSADDYVDLIDHPVEIAEQQSVSFDVVGIEHRFMVRGAPPIDLARLADDVGRICTQHHQLLGTPKDLDRYSFLAYALDSGYGGLEHRFSTSLACSRADLPLLDVQTEPERYEKLLGLISHEYFHLWNVRRLKPAAFTPLDMSAEVHTGLLWVFEGITSYYDDLAMVRSGAITREDYLRLLAQMITRVLRAPGRLVQSLEASSFDAWTKFYKQDENGPNAIVSYYAKGALAAIALDLKLRAESEVSLDDVMRCAWQRFYLDGETGMPERGLEAIASELSGLDLTAFFDMLIRGTEDVDLPALFAPFAIDVVQRASMGGADSGGRPGDESKALRSYTGLRFLPGDNSKIGVVLQDSPAQVAGISAGDQLVAINARKAMRADVDLIEKSMAPGAALEIHVFRRDEMISTTLTLAAAEKDTLVLAIASDAAAGNVERLNSWLS